MSHQTRLPILLREQSDIGAMIRRMRSWDWSLDEIRVALVQGLTYEWIAQHILGGVTWDRVRYFIQQRELGGARQMGKRARDLTKYHDLRDAGLFYCRNCGLLGNRLKTDHNSCRACENARLLNYYHHDPRAKKARKEWCQRNPDKVLEYRLRWQARHPEQAK